MKLRLISAMFFVASLVGCAAGRPDDLGTQVGRTSKIYAEQAVPTTLPECLVDISNERRASGYYVEIEFTESRQYRHVNAFVPVEMSLHLAEKVVVRYPYCIGSHKPEVTSVVS